MTSETRPVRRVVQALAHHGPRLGLALVAVVPLVLVLSFSLRQPGLAPPRSIEWVPDPIAWENYRRIFDVVPFGRFLANSILVVAIALPVTIVTASWAGFGIVLSGQRMRRALVVACILLMMVPVTALWLPRFLLYKQFGIIDTVWALVIPAVMGSSPLFVLLYYWSFRRIPMEQFEAARLDGAGTLTLWRRIALPQARAATVTVAVLCFVLYWSDFFSPLLYLKSESLYTAPVGLQILQQMDKTNWPLLMAGATIITVPIIVLFLSIQHYFWPTDQATQAVAVKPSGADEAAGRSTASKSS